MRIILARIEYNVLLSVTINLPVYRQFPKPVGQQSASFLAIKTMRFVFTIRKVFIAIFLHKCKEIKVWKRRNFVL